MPASRLQQSGVMARFDYGRRWLGTAISFAAFGLGGLLLGITVLPLILLLVRNPVRRRYLTRSVAGRAQKLFVFLMRSLGVLDYEITGLEHINAAQNYLILANHPSLIDVIFLLSVFPNADCVIKAQLRRNTFIGPLLSATDYIVNTDPVALFEKSVERLRGGSSLILFPEGTRTEPGKPLTFLPGAAAIAARTDCLCLPVMIRCTPTTLTKADRWYQVPSRKVWFEMAIQPAIRPSRVIGDDISARIGARDFNSYLQQYFSENLSSGSEIP